MPFFLKDFDMTDMDVNAQAINETCLILRCFLNDNFRYIVGCGVTLRILLDPPSVFFAKSLVILSLNNCVCVLI